MPRWSSRNGTGSKCSASTALVEGVHFDRAFRPPDAIGHRALAVNLSDLAAMGASPRLALLSFALPADAADRESSMGSPTVLATQALRHRMHVVGGNLTRTPGPLTIDVTVIGTVKRRQALTRAGALPGDELYVTGTVGSARAGLEQLRRGVRSPLAEAYLRPEARVRIGTLLARNRLAAACMDLSDGLADGVRQIAAASGVGAAVDGDVLPIDPAAHEWFVAEQQDRGSALSREATTTNCCSRSARGCVAGSRRSLRHVDTPVTRIGVCTEGTDAVLTSAGREALPLPAGYGHFR